MNTSHFQSEAGFTLIEVLVAAAIVVILGGLSVQAYVIYKDDSYHRIAMQMMGQARTAMEAGKIDSESFPDANLVVSQATAGPATDGDADLIVPGLVLPDDFQVYVFHNPGCAVAGCMEDYVITRHCKTDQRVVYWKTHQSGENIVWNSAAAGGC